MKKPASKPDNRIRKQERRNFQIGAAKRNSVHPEAGIYPVSNVIDGRTMTQAEIAARDAISQTDGNGVASGETLATETTVEPKPLKLNEAMITRFVESIRETGGPIEFHCLALGINKTTYYDWRKRAQALPGTIYERFVAAVDEAQGERLKKLYVAAEHSRPHEILFRQYPQLFPSDAVRLQIGGIDGAPLFPPGENAFTVKLELHVPDKASTPEPEREFRIVDAEIDEASAEG